MSLSKRISFKQYIQEELSHYKLPLLLKNYLTEILSYYIRSEKLFEKKKGAIKYSEKQLLDLCQKSRQISNTSEKLYLLKSIGDFSLYLSGFFRESLKRKITHLSYYEDLGESAYYMIGQNYENQFNLFEKLSKNFKNLSKILFSLQKKSCERRESKYLLTFQSESLYSALLPQPDKKIH